MVEDRNKMKLDTQSSEGLLAAWGGWEQHGSLRGSR